MFKWVCKRKNIFFLNLSDNNFHSLKFKYLLFIWTLTIKFCEVHKKWYLWPHPWPRPWPDWFKIASWGSLRSPNYYMHMSTNTIETFMRYMVSPHKALIVSTQKHYIDMHETHGIDVRVSPLKPYYRPAHWGVQSRFRVIYYMYICILCRYVSYVKLTA